MNNPIDIDQSAKTYIRQHGGIVTVRLSPRHGCCGGLANVAIAEANSPKNPELYQRHDDSNITLYIDPELADQGLIVKVEGWWKLRRLYVDGAAIQTPRQH